MASGRFIPIHSLAPNTGAYTDEPFSWASILRTGVLFQLIKLEGQHLRQNVAFCYSCQCNQQCNDSIVYHDVMSTKTQAKMSMLIDVSPSTGYGYNTL